MVRPSPPSRVATSSSWATGSSSRSPRRWTGHPPLPPARALRGGRSSPGHGLAGRRGTAGGERIGQGPCHRTPSHPDPGSGLRHRPAGGDRHTCASPAVNDTFTALTCIDWISAGLSKISGRVLEEGVYRGRSGKIRLIEFDPSYGRMVNRAFDKIRQAGRGMPAVIIRLLDALAHIAESSTDQPAAGDAPAPGRDDHARCRGRSARAQRPGRHPLRFERLTELSRALDEEASLAER